MLKNGLKLLKNKLKSKNYRKIITIVLLMNFLIFPMYAEPQTEQAENSSESEMNYYSDLEVELLIDELTVIALEAIEQAAGEAARQQAENQRLRSEAEILKRAGIKNNVLIGVLCFIGGLAVGVAGTVLIIR